MKSTEHLNVQNFNLGFLQDPIREHYYVLKLCKSSAKSENTDLDL